MSILGFESLISVSSDENSFYVHVSTMQSLYTFLRDNYSPRNINRYLKLIANLLENNLSKKKEKQLRIYLAKIIANEVKGALAARYFKDRFSQVDFIELLKHHHKLTGNLLILTNINHSEKNFKIRQVKLSCNSY